MTTPALEALPRELLVVEGARQIRDGDLVIVGTGLPLLAATLAQRTHAPGAKLVIESGVMFPRVVPTPVSVVDPRLMHGASRHGSLFEALGGLVQRGLVRTGFLGGAQVDEYGNINSTWVPRSNGERIRLPGSGGANDIASHCRQVVVLTDHERRRFPRRCDYVTSPGFLSGPGARAEAGLPPLAVKVVTDLCVMEAEDTALAVTALMPGATERAVLDNTGFVPEFSPSLTTVAPPAPEDLRLLREELDPACVYFPERKSR
ncbi:CoA-transferase subunit beta [Streptosporangium carneum]|uniref:3-oxoadipate--succinyl-CoA transferase subunit B n=1 Tax=Streptosporangium carneum TaxID=47481 RepID=A0A9W6I5F7_9ACTN|nr:CoA-transferase [Streptosporangium carneum]GLK12437.1 3-oxoadipate--succinyl-CoA transferase subunit B [Streptosporangium carneum]